MHTKLRLQRIEVEGFRGVNRPVRMDLGPQATLVFAANGKGKTSLLGAVEWCLFGELRHQERENAANDEVVNLQHFSGRCVVKLVLAQGADEVVVQRTRVAGKRASELTVSGPGIPPCQGKEASAFLFRLTGLTLADFSRAVFLHQESVRGLLTEEPKARDEALDRLFGLEHLRSILAAIPMRAVADAIEAREQQRRRQTERLSGAAEAIERERSRRVGCALAAGLAEEQLTAEEGTTMAQGVMAELQAIAREGGHEAPALPDLPMDDLDQVAERLQEATRTMRVLAAKVEPGDAASHRLVTLRRLQGELRVVREAEQEAVHVHQASLEAWGGPEVAQQRRQRWEADLHRWQEERRLLGVQERVLADALEYLRSEPQATTCPVCEEVKARDALLASVEARLHGPQRAAHEQLSERMHETQAKLEALADAQRQHDHLQRRRDEAGRAVGRVLEEVRQVLGAWEGAEDPLAMLAREEQEVARRLEGMKTAQARREERLQRIERDADRLRLIAGVLKSGEGFAALRGRETSGDDGLAPDHVLAGLSELQEALEAIVQATHRVAGGRALASVEASREAVGSLYRALGGHPYFDGIRIEVGERSIGEPRKNTYSIRAYATADGKTTLASARLSTAQMNCVALSVYLALSKVPSHNLGFLILDDPSQSLDGAHKAALARLLGKMRSERQLVVATHDEEFAGLLRDEFRGEGTSAYALDWHPRTGTVVAPEAR